MSQLSWPSRTENGHPHSSAVDAHFELFLHDVRTPLAVVLGVLETLTRMDDELDRDTRRDLIVRATEQARTVQRFMAGYEEFQRLTTGTVEPDRRPVDVDALLEEVVRTGETGADVDLRLGAAETSIDPELTRRAVRLLIDNVTMHAPVGSAVTLSSEISGGGVLITVDDDGPGVPPGLRERIFEPFERGDAPRHRGGIGLGLPIVRRIAHLHEGDAWAEAAPGGGARIRLLLR